MQKKIVKFEWTDATSQDSIVVINDRGLPAATIARDDIMKYIEDDKQGVKMTKYIIIKGFSASGDSPPKSILYLPIKTVFANGNGHDCIHYESNALITRSVHLYPPAYNSYEELKKVDNENQEELEKLEQQFKSADGEADKRQRQTEQKEGGRRRRRKKRKSKRKSKRRTKRKSKKRRKTKRKTKRKRRRRKR